MNDEYEQDGESILEKMLDFAVYDEVNSGNQSLFTTSDEDLELKKLLWTQVFSLCTNI